MMVYDMYGNGRAGQLLPDAIGTSRLCRAEDVHPGTIQGQQSADGSRTRHHEADVYHSHPPQGIQISFCE